MLASVGSRNVSVSILISLSLSLSLVPPNPCGAFTSQDSVLSSCERAYCALYAFFFRCRWNFVCSVRVNCKAANSISCRKLNFSLLFCGSTIFTFAQKHGIEWVRSLLFLLPFHFFFFVFILNGSGDKVTQNRKRNTHYKKLHAHTHTGKKVAIRRVHLFAASVYAKSSPWIIRTKYNVEYKIMRQHRVWFRCSKMCTRSCFHRHFGHMSCVQLCTCQ